MLLINCHHNYADRHLNGDMKRNGGVTAEETGGVAAGGADLVELACVAATRFHLLPYLPFI